jgi:hypothetical protein
MNVNICSNNNLLEHFCQGTELPHQKSTPNSIDASYKKVLQIILIIT